MNDDRHSLLFPYTPCLIQQSDILKMQIRSCSFHFLIPPGGLPLLWKDNPSSLPSPPGSYMIWLLPTFLTSSSTTLLLIYNPLGHWPSFCSLTLPGLFPLWGFCTCSFLLWDIRLHHQALLVIQLSAQTSSLQWGLSWALCPNEHASSPSLLSFTPIWNHSVPLIVTYLLSFLPSRV